MSLKGRCKILGSYIKWLLTRILLLLYETTKFYTACKPMRCKYTFHIVIGTIHHCQFLYCRPVCMHHSIFHTSLMPVNSQATNCTGMQPVLSIKSIKVFITKGFPALNCCRAYSAMADSSNILPVI